MAGKVIYVEQRMVKSKAWLSLNGTAKDMFLIFLTKRQMVKSGRRGKRTFDVANNGRIVFTYDEGKEQYGINAARFARGLDNLVANGFIDITEQGGGVKGYTTKYAISERWRLYGQEQFETAKRMKRNWGRSNLIMRNFPTNDFVSGSTNVFVRGRGKKGDMTSNVFVRGLSFKNVLKWRGHKWLRQKTG